MTISTIKVGKIAAAGLALLEREIVIPNLVTTRTDVGGDLDDVVTIKIPARAKARSMALRPANEVDRTIQLDNLTQRSVQVTIDENIYHAVGIEDEVNTLDVTSFAAEILQPQVRAIAEAWEDKIAGVIEDAPYVHEVDGTTARPVDAILDARKLLFQSDVEPNGCTLLIGSEVEAIFSKSDQIQRVDWAGGDNSTAIRDASIGRIGGYNAVVSNAIDPFGAYIFHKTAFSSAWKAPKIPQGAVAGKQVQLQGGKGAALTWIVDYDALQQRDRSVVRVYAGAGYTSDPADDVATNTFVKNGGLIRAAKIVFPGGGS